MKFIRALIGEKRDAASKAESEGAGDDPAFGPVSEMTDEEKMAMIRAHAPDLSVSEMLSSVNQRIADKPQNAQGEAAQQAPDMQDPLGQAPETQAPVTQAQDTQTPDTPKADTQKPEASVNIWDLEADEIGFDPADDATQDAPAMAAPEPAATRAGARARRTKTRLIGFDKSNGEVVDLFSDAPKAEQAGRTKFPVGWIAVVDGPGRGESMALTSGMSQIGRGDDQAIQLDFGDTSISRTNHAAIVYDPETKEFYLGHGGKTNIVRLNDKPVVSTETLKSGDVIRIGETKLRFVALCDKSFNWSDGATGEDEDVAIA